MRSLFISSVIPQRVALRKTVSGPDLTDIEYRNEVPFLNVVVVS